MLKTSRDGKQWFVTQPDHAEVAGYLAAHWGNDDFAAPGYFASVADPERLHEYIERPPVSLRRLTYRDDGMVHYQGSRFHPGLGRDHQLLTRKQRFSQIL